MVVVVPPHASAWRTRGALLALVLLGAACASTTTSVPGAGGEGPPARVAAVRAPRPAVPEVEVVFHDGKAFARENGREWPIAEVGRNEMLWAPDGLRFAYLKETAASAPISALFSSRTAARGASRSASIRASAIGTPTYHIVIRNIRGDSVNEFAVYRRGKPSELDWLDNARIGYLAPPDASGDAYVIHSAESGEVSSVYRGRGFTWSPGRKQLAYLTVKPAVTVRVGDEVVWPRESPGGKSRRRIVGAPVWSPDGQSLAFMEVAGSKGTLVVLLVLDNKEGDLTWPLPPGALDPDQRIFWAESKVTIGRTAFQPRFAASWRRVR
jgi:hypothetical protein